IKGNADGVTRGVERHIWLTDAAKFELCGIAVAHGVRQRTEMILGDEVLPRHHHRIGNGIEHNLHGMHHRRLDGALTTHYNDRDTQQRAPKTTLHNGDGGLNTYGTVW